MKRRLFIRPGAIGDFVLSLPAVRLLKSRGEYLEVWCAAQNVPLAARAADRAAAISATGLDLLAIPDVAPPEATVRTLAGFDDVVSCYGAGRPEFRDAVNALGLPFRFLPALPAASGPVHAADFFLQQVGGAPPAVPALECRAATHGRIVIHPFSGGRAKNWPPAHFRRLAAEIESLGHDVAWCAGPEEELAGAVRIENLYDLACWLSGARLYIGNDSGISHLAAAAGAPVVALFAPTDPAVWAPRGPRVRIVAGSSMAAIPLEPVLAACREMLEKTA